MKNYKNSFIFNFNFYEGGIILFTVFLFFLGFSITESSTILNLIMEDINNLISFVYKVFELGIEAFYDANPNFFKEISTTKLWNAIPLIVDIIFILKVEKNKKKEKEFKVAIWTMLCLILLSSTICDL